MKIKCPNCSHKFTPSEDELYLDYEIDYDNDESFGPLESLEINGMIFEGKDLPECFRIKSPNACYLSVPEDHQIDKLNITGTNIWGGTS